MITTEEGRITVEPMSGGAGRPSSFGSARLQQIADALGVPVEALSTPRQPYGLHLASDGARWASVLNAEGIPVVRHIASLAADRPETVESVSVFLARSSGSLQHQALATFIDRLLTIRLMK